MKFLQETADLITFIGEIYNGKPHFCTAKTLSIFVVFMSVSYIFPELLSIYLCWYFLNNTESHWHTFNLPTTIVDVF